MLDYTVADDRIWDSHLLRWDILGSLGHAEGLRASGLLTVREHAALRRGLREALAAVGRGELGIEPQHEDVHSAVEFWLTARLPDAGQRLHTGRSRNDQVTVDLRLYCKHRALACQAHALDLAAALLAFATRHRTALWPGYTHQRRAMPSSGALWAGAYAEGILDTAEQLPALWRRLDRSPLGSAAGYGVPLPLRREVTARALGFGGLDQMVTTVQNQRGKLEAAVLFWGTQFGHDLSRLAHDVILFTAQEFGWLVLPPELATGSSIMPHKRNPDVFELTRARAAALDGDLGALMLVRGKLAGGYHRDFQLLKEPLMRGLDRLEEMLAMCAHAVPLLGVDRARGRAALDTGALATDEVMRRVELGEPFRAAYLDVSARFKRGEALPAPTPRDLARRRSSTGGLGNPRLDLLRRRLAAARRWTARERRRFDRAMARLAGR
ncbi:MAG: lyase family protein [Gemmatimonadales bacterium]|nr:lyase family protein [Gemmatimonadales bacterium]